MTILRVILCSNTERALMLVCVCVCVSVCVRQLNGLYCSHVTSSNVIKVQMKSETMKSNKRSRYCEGEREDEEGGKVRKDP